MDITGNDTADSLAKDAILSVHSKPLLAVPPTHIKSLFVATQMGRTTLPSPQNPAQRYNILSSTRQS